MNVYGPRQDYQGAYIAVIMKMLDAIDRGEGPTILGDGSEAFDFVAVEDCATRQSVRDVGRSCRPLLQCRHRQAHLAQGARRDAAATHRLEPADRYAPRSQATLVRNRIGSPKRAREEIGFEAADRSRRRTAPADRLAPHTSRRGRAPPCQRRSSGATIRGAAHRLPSPFPRWARRNGKPFAV